MNPFTFIIDDYYGDTTARFGLAAAAVLLLKVLADHYAGDMPAGPTATVGCWTSWTNTAMTTIF